LRSTSTSPITSRVSAVPHVEAEQAIAAKQTIGDGALDLFAREADVGDPRSIVVLLWNIDRLAISPTV